MKVQLVIDVNVLDEALLRRIASERMSISGFETDPAEHAGKPLSDLIFEALIGSNPDTVSPVDMGIEIADWRAQAAGSLANAMKTLIKYAEAAPAADPGEGYWRNLDYAYAHGQRNERYTAADKIRNALQSLGLDVPAGVPICPSCSVDEGEEHEPDCTIVEEEDEEEDEEI